MRQTQRQTHKRNDILCDDKKTDDRVAENRNLTTFDASTRGFPPTQSRYRLQIFACKYKCALGKTRRRMRKSERWPAKTEKPKTRSTQLTVRKAMEHHTPVTLCVFLPWCTLSWTKSRHKGLSTKTAQRMPQRDKTIPEGTSEKSQRRMSRRLMGAQRSTTACGKATGLSTRFQTPTCLPKRIG